MSNDDEALHQAGFNSLVGEITQSLAVTREAIKAIKSEDTAYSDGISLLSLKHHGLISYIRSLTLTIAHRAAAHSLTARTSPTEPFSDPARGPRGSEPGDLVDSALETRIVLEKIKVLEGRMRYQIEKLVRAAGDEAAPVDDPLAFRPNPANLAANQDDEHDENDDSDSDAGRADVQDADGIYRPPRLAPVPYTGGSSKSKRDARPAPNALSALAHMDPSRPLLESTSGLGGGTSSGAGGGPNSAAARAVARMTAFEEENFTRLVLNKKDAKRRKRDEEDVALGGAAREGLESEFRGVLDAVGRRRTGASLGGDGYEELRKRGKKEGVLARSRGRVRDMDTGDGQEESSQGKRKRNRFEKEAIALKKRAKTKRK